MASPSAVQSSLSSAPSPPHTPTSSSLSNDPSSATSNPSTSHYLCPDFKRRQLLFDSFSKFQHRHLGESSVSALSLSSLSSDGQSLGMGASLGGSSLLPPEGAKGSLLYSWGAGYHGQLGLNTARKKCRLTPTLIDFHEPVQQVACGGFHSALLTDDGRVFTWGDGRSGQLGNLVRKHNMHSTPHLVDFFVNSKVTISFIGCGQSHSAVISTQGKLYTFGSGKSGQLGHGIRLDERFPRRVDTDRSLGSFVRVACGDRHTAVLNEAGRVITFGSSQHGQLGHGDGNDLLRPTEITNSDMINHKVTFIECGATTTAAITDGGLLFLWGFGESIHPKGMNNVVNSPRLVQLKETIKQVGLGQGHVVVLTTQGDVLTFGTSSFGQLGHGASSNVRNPRLILRGKEIQQISCGRYHSMAVSAYGVIYSFGCNESGQLGHNNLDNGLMPKIVESILPNVIGQVKCGQHHTLALSSIQHDVVSPDVQQWKHVEDAEYKLKWSMMSANPNGLKSRHILQVEKERVDIKKQIEEQSTKEKEEKQKLAKEKIDLILNHRELIGPGAANGVVASKDVDGDDEQQYDILEIAHNKDRSNTVVETPAAQSADEDEEDDYEEDGAFEDEETKRADDDGDAKPRPRRTAFPSMGPHSQLYLDAANPQWAKKPSKGQPSSTVSKSVRDGSTSPSKPKRKADAQPALLSEKDKMDSPKSPSDGDFSSDRERLPAISPTSKRNAGRSTLISSPSTALIPSMASSDEQPFSSPLAPRISFIESQSKSLAKVKNFISANPIQGSPEYTNLLLKMKKDYNKLKNYRSKLEDEIKKLKGMLMIIKPNQEEEKETKSLMERVKQLNMKLVTLNTRLIEAEENKKNYELTIIRMKEEDLQLSKQIDHLRHLVMEYERLLLRLQKMNERVTHQKSLVYEESSQFWTEIQDFMQFADRTVGDYQSVLNASFKQSAYQENLQATRELKQEEKRSKVLNKLKEEIDEIRKSEDSILNEKSEWSQHVDFYEKKFRKISAATGLSQIDQIIAKFYFNDEITKDLQMEIEKKKEREAEIATTQSNLQKDLKECQSQQIVSKWKDVSLLESQTTEEQLKLNKNKEEAELLIQRKTMAIEALNTIWKNVKTILSENRDKEGQAEKEGEEPLKDASSSPPSSSLPSVLSASSGLACQLRLLQQQIDSTQSRLTACKADRKKIESRRKEIDASVAEIVGKENEAKAPQSPTNAIAFGASIDGGRALNVADLLNAQSASPNANRRDSQDRFGDDGGQQEEEEEKENDGNAESDDNNDDDDNEE